MLIDACCTIGIEKDIHESVIELIKIMDSAAIDMAFIHPADLFYAFENESGNTLLLDLAGKYKGRLIPTATVNPWRKDSIDIALHSIEKGAKMLSFSPAVQGFNICDHKLDNLLEKLSGNKIPVYVHCGHHSNATPCQLAILANRFKNINFICGHSGSTDYKVDAVECCRTLNNFYLESSFARPSLFVKILKDIDSKKALMGSAFPYNNFLFEWNEMKRLLPFEYQKGILGGNLKNLIGLD